MLPLAKRPRDPEVLAQIEEIDALLASSGVRELCNACWRGELKKETGGAGCCHGCSLLTPTSCTAKPLSCALWLCEYAKKKFPEVEKKLRAIRTSKWRFNSVAYLFREESLEYETNPPLFQLRID